MKRPHRDLRPILTTPAPLPPRRARPALVAVGSAVAGFVTGALFWHTIGFWNFVSDVVLKGPEEPSTVAIAQAPSTVPVAMRPTGSITPARTTVGGRGPAALKAHQTCSVAIADTTGETATVVPCAPGTLPAPVKPLAKKGDLLEVAVAAPAAQPAVLPAPPAPIAPVPPQPAPLPAWGTTIKGSVR